MDPALQSDDLSPGDRPEAAKDWSDVRVRRVLGVEDPDFGFAYDKLWREFGPRNEMETRAVIRDRLAWNPEKPVDSGRHGRAALAYELLVLRRASGFAALRDHTAAVRLDAAGRPVDSLVVVHLSHSFVDPSHRGTGLIAWLRSLPLQAARRCARAAGLQGDAPCVLVAEMEAPDPLDVGRMARLRSYARAGFQKVDPEAAPYFQPDFRPPEVLAGATPQPVPLQLVMRRVGREHEERVPAAEIAAIVASLYAVYGVHTPAAALDPLRADAERWTARESSFRLLLPTA